MPRREKRGALKPDPLFGLPLQTEAEWLRLVNDYTEGWRKAQGRAPKTRELDRTLLLRLLKWVVERDIPPASFTENEALEFVAGLDSQYEARGTNMTIQAVRLFGDMAVHKQVWEVNPFRGPGIQYRREVQGRAVKYLTDKEVGDLLASPDQRKPSGVRDYTIIALLLGTGMRSGEVCHLKGSDLFLDSCMLRVAGETAKTRRERWVSLPYQKKGQQCLLHPMLDRPLQHWLRIRAAMGLGPDDPLFCSVSRHEAHRPQGEALTPLQILQAIVRYGKRAGIEHRIHPHLCRHTAIRRMRKLGLPNDEIKAQVGHVSTEVLEGYGRSSREDAHDAFGAVDIYSGARSAKSTRPRVPRPSEVQTARQVLEAAGIDPEEARRELEEDQEED